MLGQLDVINENKCIYLLVFDRLIKSVIIKANIASFPKSSRSILGVLANFSGAIA